MLTVICECGTQWDDIDWLENEWAAMWRKHGHFPGRVTLLCVCGEHHEEYKRHEKTDGKGQTIEWQEVNDGRGNADHRLEQNIIPAWAEGGMS